jgi:para-aminobenzoate synthetase component 1
MIEKISFLAKKNIPFLFVIDFEKTNIFVEELSKLKGIYFEIEDFKNYTPFFVKKKVEFQKFPMNFCEYRRKFEKVINEIKKGNTYLLNLCFPTKIYTNLSLKEIFYISKARFKLFFRDRFVCFSPERFIKIKNNRIFTYPMKGTIPADIPEAEKKILSNPKETAEHIMIVDLLRNDLSMVSKEVKVNRFRYVEKLKTNSGELFQVSSEIEGKLQKGWEKDLGSIIFSLLPAGSISGTPKIKTLQIIKKIEGYKRGFFTGIFGIYNNHSLDSAVIIRYIEKDNSQLLFKSGGGITIESNPVLEYQELIQKVYIPI